MTEKEIGKISHWYGNINVAVVELSDKLKVGDEVHIKGASTDFTQTVDSMQIEHQPIKQAKKGDAIGLQTSEKVREGDIVYRVQGE